MAKPSQDDIFTRNEEIMQRIIIDSTNDEDALFMYNNTLARITPTSEQAAALHCAMGERFQRTFLAIRLSGNNEKELRNKMKVKTQTLRKAADYFTKTIKCGNDHYSARATYRIGQGFIQMAMTLLFRTVSFSGFTNLFIKLSNK